MPHPTPTRLLVFALLFAALATTAQASTIRGQVRATDGKPVAGVVVESQGRRDVTGPDGRFRLSGLPAGTYELSFTLGRDRVTQSGVALADGQDATVAQMVEWVPSAAETITVTGASRHTERLLDAPASVDVIAPEAIEGQVLAGQLPRLVGELAGVDVAQSGTHDFNLSVRGLNTSLSRRVLTLIDGRDPSILLLGAQNWAGWARWMAGDLGSVEVIRGPNSALYGADAFNGVVNLTTEDPGTHPGGRLTVGGGELSTGAMVGRYAGKFGDGWDYRVIGGYSTSHDFARSRVGVAEYEPSLLPREAVPLPLDRIESHSLSGRLDRHWDGDRTLELEGGYISDSGATLLNPTGRNQLQSSKNPFVRAAWHTPGVSLRASFDDTTGDSVALYSGEHLITDGQRVQAEAMLNQDLGHHALLVAGVSWRYSRVDTANDSGQQTVLRGVTDEHRGGVFGQLDVQIRDDLKLVLGGRADASSLIETQFSPKAALVYNFRPGHSLRVTYGRAYQSPNFVELNLRNAAAPPVDLSGIEAALAPALGGVPLGFSRVPVLALGNSELEAERVDGIDVGYTATIGSKALLSLDYYNDHYSDFITGLQPQIGTALGRVNPSFGAYAPPAALSPAQAALLVATLSGSLPLEQFATLSNDRDGSPIFAVASYGNFGKVRTQGFEAELRAFLGHDWTVDLAYSLFDFDARTELASSPLEGNAPRHKLSGTVTYHHDDLTLRGHGHWVDRFSWASGLLRGPVPEYTVFDVSGSYRVHRGIGVSVDVANLFDDRHYEAFGGDLLGRRALGSLIFSW